MVARADWSLRRIDGPAVLEPVDEADFLGTNGSAQYGLSAIQNLALIGDHLPSTISYLPPSDQEHS
ncbi:exo-rhamnogalacturonan lyase family protein [Brachybacterium tyrofermentans]|uniref:exo-rhamnogalacturonan lyase family protein n=1 Tax=Brachybacterium tyrofermentans TaxID=47848 RepID=UPI003FD23524